MKTTRTSYKQFLGYMIKHISDTDIWSIHAQPSFELIAIAHSLNDARKMIFRELPLINR